MIATACSNRTEADHDSTAFRTDGSATPAVVVFKPAPFTAKILLAVPKQPLHIALTTRIVAKHKAVKPNVLTAKDTIKWLCLNRGDLSKENQKLLEALERGTGLSITELAALTDDWPD